MSLVPDPVKILKKKTLGEYQDFYVQSDTLLLADVFENFRNMCLKIYELDSAKIISTPGLSWQAVRPFNWYQHVISGRKKY